MSKTFIPKRLSQAMLVLTSAGLQRATPIAMGVFILRFYGEESYKYYSYILIVISLSVVFISAGMIPTILRNVALNHQDVIRQKEILQSSYFFSFVLWVFVCVALLSLKLLGYFFENLSWFEILLLSISALGVILVTLSSAFLQSMKELKLAIYPPTFFFISLVFTSFIAFILRLPFTIYLCCFFVTYFIIGVSSLYFVYLKLILSYKSLIQPKRNLLHFRKIYRESLGVFFYNLVWMLGIFQFHTYISHNESLSNSYEWFALGYQWFTLIIFIPGALAPLVIPYFAQGRKDEFPVIGLAILYAIFASFIFLLLSYNGLFLKLLYGLDVALDNQGFDIYKNTLIAGIFAAFSAPLIQYLIGRNKLWVLWIAAISWLLTSLSPQTQNDLSEYYSLFFLVSYFVSTCVLVIATFSMMKSDDSKPVLLS